MKKITEFRQRWAFLSNFYPVNVYLDNQVYRSVEHAYQAAKTSDPQQRAYIRFLPSAGEAKRAGKRITPDVGWEARKLDVMRGLLRQKFAGGPLREQLLRTGAAKLEEHNGWGDRYWGICRGEGDNHLGRLLMEIRAELLAKEKP